MSHDPLVPAQAGTQSYKSQHQRKQLLDSRWRGRERLERQVAILGCVLAAMLATNPAAAQANWPTKPIHLIVPFTPGSSSDIVARIVAQKLGERLKQQLVVENRVGASGSIGSEAVARAEADGYTIGLANTSTQALAASFGNIPYDPVKDFAPVAMIGHSPFVLATYPGLPAKSIKELIALAKAAPKKYTMASAGPATLADLAGTLLEKMADIELTHVSYRGTAQSTLDLIGGRVDMQFGTIPPSLANIREGKIRALAVTGAARSAVLPDVPTVAEAGLPGYESVLWQAIVAPAAMPKEIVARLNREIVEVLADAGVKASLDKQGVVPEPGSPEALGQRIRKDIVKWRDVMKSAGIKTK
jgi:tripartite-type tricarboxylate transporter receptor subunit TctC